MHSYKSISERTTFSDGYAIPRLGLGVYNSPAGRTTVETILEALKLGYRHFDTAAFYGNEADVGTAIRESGIDRKEIFVTTKLWNSEHGYDKAQRAFDQSFKLLNIDYIDLYLIHWPVPDLRLESWRALVKLRNEKRVRSIGVSNFMINHLEELFANFEDRPVLNQFELSPFLAQNNLRTFCAKHQIVVEGYCPLTRGRRFNDPTIVALSQKHNKTPAQILNSLGARDWSHYHPQDQFPSKAAGKC